jgi:threonine/homoserine/homoserine lactone efflux protein
MDIFFQSFMLGLAITIPVGPATFLCINSTLNQGFRHGLVTSIGITLADSLYALVAVLGLGTITVFTSQYGFIPQVLGSLFLAYLGVKNLRKSSTLDAQKVVRASLLKNFLSSFFFTLSSPATLILFLAAMSLVQFQADMTRDIVFILLGFMLACMGFWLLLISVLLLFKKRLSENAINMMNKISGLIFIGFALVGFYMFFKNIL